MADLSHCLLIKCNMCLLLVTDININVFFNLYYKSKYWKFMNLNKCSLTSIYHFSNDKDYLLSFNFTGNKQRIRPVRLLSLKLKWIIHFSRNIFFIEMCQYAWCHNDVIKWGGFRKNAMTSMIFVSNISSNLDNYTVLSKFMKDIFYVKYNGCFFLFTMLNREI
jgi:hypothetical protein